MSNSSRNIAIIGLGSFGISLARQLDRFGDHVLGIDRSESRVSSMTEILHRSLIMDARDELAMKEAELSSYDVVVIATSSDLESSVLACMNARQVGARTIWAKAGSATHARILEKLGIDRLLEPEREYGEHIAHMLHNEAIGDYINLAASLYVATVRIGKRRAGKRLEELKLLERHQLHCRGLVRDDTFIACEADTPMLADDALLVVGKREDMRAFAEKQ